MVLNIVTEQIKETRFFGKILTLLQPTRYHCNRISDFHKNILFVEKFLENQF